MILNRMGKKTKIADELQRYFPPPSVCDMWIEPFFGAGGMFFNLTEKRKYNIVNDNDTEVFNLYTILQEKPTELRKALEIMPVDETLFKTWKKKQEVDPIRKAVRFLFLSNFGYMGKPETMRFGRNNSKRIMLDNIEATLKGLENVQIANVDFRVFLTTKIHHHSIKRGIEQCFIYNDPPYIGTENNYQQGFKEKDSRDLFDGLDNTNMRWAMSEFDHPFILSEAKKRGLTVIEIGERVNMKNRRTEILVLNYNPKTFEIIGKNKRKLTNSLESDLKLARFYS